VQSADDSAEVLNIESANPRPTHWPDARKNSRNPIVPVSPEQKAHPNAHSEYSAQFFITKKSGFEQTRGEVFPIAVGVMQLSMQQEFSV